MAGRNVFIFHSGALGDFVLTWPMILGVARTMPQCRVIVVAGADKGKLAEKVLRVESRDVEGGWGDLFGDGELAERPTHLLEAARLVLSFVAAERSTWEDNVRRIAADAELHFLSIKPTRDGVHAADFLLEQLAADPVLYAGTAGMMESIRKTGLMSRAFDAAGPLVVHPGSGSPAKNWPADQWLDWIKRQDRPIRVLVGEAERERLAPETLAKFAGAAEVVEPATLPTLVDTLTGVSGFVGHDSGPTHLAAMLGLPTLALFGPTDPAAWSPLGPRVTVLRHQPLASLDPADVAAP